MPVYGGFDGQLILHEHLQGVVLVGFDERSRLLTIDQIDRAGEPICNTVIMEVLDYAINVTNQAPLLLHGS